MKLWQAAFALAITAGGCALMYQAFEEGWLAFNHPSRETYPIRGIDVSHHKGVIDWPAVAADGYRFAYVKASEGGDFTDPRFAANWAGARAAGLAVGAYHFFTFCRPASEQAAHYVNVVPREADALPPAVDLEFGGNCSRVPTKAEMAAELAAFLEPVRAAYGKEPILYVTQEFYEAYTPAGPLWARDVFLEPHWLGDRAWTIWQYGNRGAVPGITGHVDLNAFHAGDVAWTAFRSGRP